MNTEAIEQLRCPTTAPTPPHHPTAPITPCHPTPPLTPQHPTSFPHHPISSTPPSLIPPHHTSPPHHTPHRLTPHPSHLNTPLRMALTIAATTRIRRLCCKSPSAAKNLNVAMWCSTSAYLGSFCRREGGREEGREGRSEGGREREGGR